MVVGEIGLGRKLKILLVYRIVNDPHQAGTFFSEYTLPTFQEFTSVIFK